MFSYKDNQIIIIKKVNLYIATTYICIHLLIVRPEKVSTKLEE